MPKKYQSFSETRLAIEETIRSTHAVAPSCTPLAALGALEAGASADDLLPISVGRKDGLGAVRSFGHWASHRRLMIDDQFWMLSRALAEAN